MSGRNRLNCIRFWFHLLVLGISSSLGCIPTYNSDLYLPGIVESQEVRLSSKVGGRVQNVLVREGDSVSADQVLIVIDGAELQAKRAQLEAQRMAAAAKLEMLQNGPLPEQIAAARASVEVAAARLQKMETGWRTEEIEMAKLDVELWQAEYERSKADYERIDSLRGTTAFIQFEADFLRAAMLKAQAQWRSTAKRLEMLHRGTRAEEIAEAKAELARLKADYDLVQRGPRDEEIAIAEAQLEEMVARVREVDVSINECSVIAPQACLIEVVAVRPGDVAAPNQPLVRGLYPDDVWVKAYVPETELHRLRLHQRVQVTHDQPRQPVWGEITFIADSSEFTPRNVQSADERRNQVFAIKIRLEDPQGVLKSGMAARVRIPAATAAAREPLSP